MFCRFRYDGQGVFLTCGRCPACVSAADIQRVVSAKGISRADELLVAQAFAQPDQEVRIAPPQSEQPLDERVSVTLGRDNMAAHLTFYPPEGGDLITLRDVYNALLERGVVEGVAHDRLRELLRDPDRSFYTPLLIAEGRAPQSGAGAEMELLFKPPVLGLRSILPGGSVDPYCLSRHALVSRGNPLARLVPGTPGIAGLSVLGEVVPPGTGYPTDILSGPNTLLSADQLTVTAAIAGHADYLEGRIVVLPVLEVNGDVTSESPAIDFLGDVVISGSVSARVTIRAAGSIDILGRTENAVIRAGRDVVAREGFFGRMCSIMAGGSVAASVIDEATVTACGDVTAHAIRDARVTTLGTVYAMSDYGQIIGGVTRAGVIRARIVGGRAQTVLEAGNTPAMRAACERVVNEMNQLRGEYARVKEELGRLAMRVRHHDLSAEEAREQERLADQLSRFELQMPAKREQTRRAQERLQSSNGGVFMHDAVYQDTIVCLGEDRQEIDTVLHGASFVLQNGQISRSEYAGE